MEREERCAGSVQQGMKVRGSLLLASLVVVAAGCSAPFDGESVGADHEALRALEGPEVVGTIAYGQTSSPVSYTKTPLYRAFRFSGAKGDAIEAWVRSTDGDARAWLLGSSFGTVASNLDAAPGNKDSRIQATLKSTGTYYVVFRETARKDATFTVSLAKSGGGCALAPALTPKWEAGASGRPNGPMLFDSKRHRLVVLSASGTSELGASGWSPPSGDPLPPGGRSEATIAYDSDRGRAVLFGGGGNGSLLGDTWEWDGATDTWTKLTPAGLTPRARSGHALVYDAARKKTVLFGGVAEAADFMQDTWTWDGSGWTRVGTPSQPHPEARTGHHMAFDAARGRVVLYGQYGGWQYGSPHGGAVGQPSTAKGNTWEWDGATWYLAPQGQGGFTSDDPTSLPMAFDPGSGRVVRVDVTGERYLKKLIVREWTGKAWSTISSSDGPSVNIASAVQYFGAYDPNRGRFVLANTGYDWQTSEFFFFKEPNRAPNLLAVPDRRVFAGDELAFSLTAYDADGQEVHYQIAPLPAGATLDAQTGAFLWSPTVAQAGSYTMTATASDGCAQTARSFTIRVDDIGYAELPNGSVKLAGKVSVPVYVYETRTYNGRPELTCKLFGDNPGKVTVRCDGPTTVATAYGGYTFPFAPAPMSAPLEKDLSFAYEDGPVAAHRELVGRLEPLSDGTYKLHITAWAQPVVGTTPGAYAVMKTEISNTYGVVDVVP